MTCTLYPIPYTLYPIPYTLYPIPYTIYPIPYTLYPVPYTPYPVPHTLSYKASSLAPEPPKLCTYTLIQGSRCDATEAIRLLLPARITVFTLDLSGSGINPDPPNPRL